MSVFYGLVHLVCFFLRAVLRRYSVCVKIYLISAEW